MRAIADAPQREGREAAGKGERREPLDDGPSPILKSSKALIIARSPAAGLGLGARPLVRLRRPNEHKQKQINERICK
jgi:hypothetical protein